MTQHCGSPVKLNSLKAELHEQTHNHATRHANDSACHLWSFAFLMTTLSWSSVFVHAVLGTTKSRMNQTVHMMTTGDLALKFGTSRVQLDGIVPVYDHSAYSSGQHNPGRELDGRTEEYVPISQNLMDGLESLVDDSIDT